MEKESPSYYAIIPASVRYADIPANAKLLYGEITALCNKEGYCWANNKYFAKLYNVSEFTVSRWISKLAKKKLLNVDIIKAQKGQEVLRKMSIPIDEKSKGGIDEKSKDNNTSINNTNNNPLTPFQGETIKEIWNKYKTPPQGVRVLNKTAVQRLLPECRKWTQDLEREYKALLKKGYTDQDIELSIKRYCTDIIGRAEQNGYASHRFSILEFIKQSNGMRNYINK